MMRKLKLHATYTEMDFWRFVLFLCVAQVYIRNPVGLNVLGADSVGARPYFVVGLAFASSFILSKYRIQPLEVRWSMWATIFGAFITLPINSWRYGFSRGGPALETVEYTEGMEGEGAGRVGKYNTWARSFSVIIGTYKNPLRACFHPGWALLILLTLALAALSGYRNTVAYVGIAFLVGIAYRGGIISLIISTVIGVFALGSLALLNLAYPLPANVQRALSPLPGTWEERYVEGAERSTEWRVDMWKAALLTDDWIRNKILGDGVGMTREEHTRMQELDSRRSSRAIGTTLTRQQEGMMLAGNYHSGPVQTVRIVGYVGLIVMWLAMIRMMVHMHRLILRARGTEWYVPVLFYGIPLMTQPFFWTFVFGEFRGGVVFICMSSAMIDLLNKNLPLPAYVKPKREPYVLMRNRPQVVGEQ
jgi:hypothetical protein